MDAKSAFEHHLWPALLQLGWKFEVGLRPCDKYYLPPGITSRKGQQHRVDYFDSKMQVVHALRQNERFGGDHRAAFKNYLELTTKGGSIPAPVPKPAPEPPVHLKESSPTQRPKKTRAAAPATPVEPAPQPKKRGRPPKEKSSGPATSTTNSTEKQKKLLEGAGRQQVTPKTRTAAPATPVESAPQPKKRGRPPKQKTPVPPASDTNCSEKSDTPSRASKRQQVTAGSPASKIQAKTVFEGAKKQNTESNANTPVNSKQSKPVVPRPTKSPKPLLTDIVAVVGKEETQAGKIRYQVLREGCARDEAVWLEAAAQIPIALIDDFEEEQRVESACCCVCRDDNSLETNLLLLCDGCDLPVHQLCYGVPEVPDGDWFCRLCAKNGNKKPAALPKCALCPFPGGALKPTTEGGWAHLQCSLWLPETSIEDSTLMEPIVGCAVVDKKREKQLSCYLCKENSGYCIQCSHVGCYTAFHPFCAARYVLHLDACEDKAGGVQFIQYCHVHDPERPLAFFQKQLPAFVFEKKPKPLKQAKPKPLKPPEHKDSPSLKIPTPSSRRERAELDVPREERRTPGSDKHAKRFKGPNPLDSTWGELGRPRMVHEIATAVTNTTAPNCHRCKISHPERGYASCENGHHHHLCSRCVSIMLDLDWSEVLGDASGYVCPVCNETCICAACTRKRDGVSERKGGSVVRRRRVERDAKGPRAQHSTKGIKGMLGHADLALGRKKFWEDDDVNYRQPITRDSAAWKMLNPEAMQNALVKLLQAGPETCGQSAPTLDEPSCGMWSFHLVVPGSGTEAQSCPPPDKANSALVAAKSPQNTTAVQTTTPSAALVDAPRLPGIGDPSSSADPEQSKASGQLSSTPTSAFVSHERLPSLHTQANGPSALGSWVSVKPLIQEALPAELRALCGPLQVKATTSIVKPCAQKKSNGAPSIFLEYDSTQLHKETDLEDEHQHDIGLVTVSDLKPLLEPVPKCTTNFVDAQLRHMDMLLQRQVAHNTALIEQVSKSVAMQLDSEVAKAATQQQNKVIEQEFTQIMMDTMKREKVSLAETMPTDDNNEACEYCNDGGDLLCCDGCPGCFHLYCISPALDEPPEGEWFCSACRDKRDRQQRLCNNMQLGNHTEKASQKPKVKSKEEKPGLFITELLSESDQMMIKKFSKLKGNPKARELKTTGQAYNVKTVSQELHLNVNCVYALLRGQWFQSPQTVHTYVDKLRTWVDGHLDDSILQEILPGKPELGILGVSLWSTRADEHRCESCGQGGGAFIACSHQGCPRHYHPHCACRDKTLYLRVGSFKMWKDSFLYCAEHVPAAVSLGLSDHSVICESTCDVCFHVAHLKGEVMPATHVCTRCHVRVHSGCYPVGDSAADWLCEPCKVDEQPTCCFCKRAEGAMLKTDNGKWAHVSCAVWTPEISIGNLGRQQESEQELYCLCRQPFTGELMIGCDICGDWFHPRCIGVDPQETSSYMCPNCKSDSSVPAVEDVATANETEQDANSTRPTPEIQPPVTLATKPARSTHISGGARTKPCASCGKGIGYNSKKCKHCGSPVCSQQKGGGQALSPNAINPTNTCESQRAGKAGSEDTDEPQASKLKIETECFVDLTQGESDDSGLPVIGGTQDS
eukprot:TRINITY_DN2879_c0_g1_i2.p1 TRINITY_DN2879_c0_g1~~TRINITY_DN2879_c0_g1_i2.p1  ORF type:complete len:1616 (-),score=156.44 TRINITY_DN2879_c0_g1_i2:254-5101(-)